MNDPSIAVSLLTGPGEPWLFELEEAYLAAINEEPLNAEKERALQKAIEDGAITYFIAWQGARAVGMCSVATAFSTFSCGPVGSFEDFYVRPAFRKQGIARKLARAAQDWCRENGIASLTACCAPCDEGMFQALGFDFLVGKTYAKLS